MTTSPFPPLADLQVISCSVVRHELGFLQASGDFPYPIEFLNSKLHLTPSNLGEQLQKKIHGYLRSGKGVLLVYGDCHASMVDMSQSARVARTESLNCIELLISKAQRREWLKKRFFFLLPEWTERWEEILLHLPGMTPEQSIDLFRRENRGLCYLDTGVVPVPTSKLLACSETLSLAYEILPVGLTHFRGVLREAVKNLEPGR